MIVSASEAVNIAGYIPVVGTPVGACRIIYGLAKTIFNGLGALFNYQNDQKRQVYERKILSGIKHMGRGCVELIPFIGLQLVLYDFMKSMSMDLT